jgi:TonB family protein
VGHFFLGVGAVRIFLIGLAFALIATPSWAQTAQPSAQTAQQRTWCFSTAATDDETIDGCTALIQSGRETTDLPIEFYNRGIGYGGKGLYDQAIADDTQAIALKPDYAEAYDNRGFAYDDKGLYDQAIADYTQAIALKPDYADAYVNRAWVYHQAGRDAQGLPDAEKAVALASSNAFDIEIRAEIYEKLGRRDEAIADYRAALKLQPDLKSALDGLKRITATPAVAPGPSAVQPVAMIANPTWIATPDADMFARNYPARALRMNLEGHAVVECTVQADGALSGCSIVSEDPPGAGFGDATLQLTGSFRMAPRTADGTPVAGARVRVPVHWRTDD